MGEAAQDTPQSLRANVLGSKLTTYNIGGLISSLYEPNSADEVVSLIKDFNSRGKSFRIVGGGSNLLIPDEGISEPVIRLGNGFKYWNALGDSRVKIGASMPLIRLSQETAQLGLSGFEFAGGIPASVGGAVRMNAGAHGSDMAAVLEQISIVTFDGQLLELSPKELEFGYRRSNVGKIGLVLGAVAKLAPGATDQILALRAKNLAHRKSAQPITLPSAGSIFKNPSTELTAGIAIERAGLKGTRIGGAEVSMLHGNWIVNPERKATAVDVKMLISKCQEVVKEKLGVSLETELVAW
jgi:UDP-N-acetylmuramate dehydrogenase